jgi:hypothetical protein
LEFRSWRLFATGAVFPARQNCAGQSNSGVRSAPQNYGHAKSYARYCRSQYDIALYDRKKKKPGEAGLVTLFDFYQGIFIRVTSLIRSLPVAGYLPSFAI